MWLLALSVGGAMIATGIVFHPSLVIGGSVVGAIALAKALQQVWGERP